MDSFNTFIANKSITKSLVWSRSRSLHYGNLGDFRKVTANWKTVNDASGWDMNKELHIIWSNNDTDDTWKPK